MLIQSHSLVHVFWTGQDFLLYQIGVYLLLTVAGGPQDQDSL